MTNILVTNDDGIAAPALDVLKESLSSIGEVTIVAPNAPKSAAGNSLTLHKPVRVAEIAERKYSVSGTPADCVRVGVLTLMDDRVDLVVSGINDGANLGDDVSYSGTVAAAREASLLGIPSIASSLVNEGNGWFDTAAGITARVAREILRNGIPERTLLNLNIPDMPDVASVRICRLGIRVYERKVRERVDPAGRKYYWIIGEKIDGVAEEGTDFKAIRDGCASLTPLGLDHTDIEFARELVNWNLN